jgi:DNA-binding HxlR family transcriptional regulator
MSTSQTTNYFSILFTISQGKRTFSKIEQGTKITSNLTHYLNTLIEMGLIERKSMLTPLRVPKMYFML